MFSHFLFFLLFETAQPSYGMFASVLPAEIVTSATAEVTATAPSLQQQNAPIKKTDSIGPVISAESVYAIDLNGGEPLFTRNVFARRQIASIAKLVTAMVILDNHNVFEKVIVSKNAATQEGSSMFLRSGEEITVENLLTGLLINSGNDAATALAEFDAGSESAFVSKMNAKAALLGLKDTHFSNAKGFDEAGNYSTAFDTMTFGRAAVSYPFIRKTVALKTAEVMSTDGRITHSLKSTNELLENPYFKIIGLKTGTTPEAGQSFVSLTEAPNDHEVLTVVLGSPDRFKETEILLDWVLRNFEFK
ncbi:D-alanyl-D-alanine carboxypeptidase [Candidatus Peregrinibacteria bacterium]|nr:D-alanyl-D-alanine carboxypeptidase [Candidatus Peregrinibacteria bacterium]